MEVFNESNFFSDGEDYDDERLNQDLEALRKACMITGSLSPSLSPSTPNPNQFDNFDFTASSLTDSSDEEGTNDDDDLVRQIQQKLSDLTSSSSSDNNANQQSDYFQPLQTFDPFVTGFSDGVREEDDDFATLQAIQRRFAAYNTTENFATDDDMDTNMEAVTLSSNTTQCFLDSIKKNRALQKIIRSKMIQIEGKIEENKKVKERVKILIDFKRLCQRRARRALSQNNNASVQLISTCRSRKVSDRKKCALFYGPVENSKVADYRNVLQFNATVQRRGWSDAERENLGKGIKQKLQEMVWKNSVEHFSDPDDMNASIANYDISLEEIRSFVPKVDWDELARLVVPGRSGAECETRWLNHEDPLICHDAWTDNDDKKILYIVQKLGMYNWISVSTSMRTRTPFQCFARFQRSLNSSVIKRDWTAEDDAQLCAAVEEFGDTDWQQVASNVPGRTGTQCSTRWMKTLNPARKRVGRWTVEEDKLLKVAVMIFRAKSWNKIAQFVPGRTQAQCRERWVNALDPYLKRATWTEEEDSMLKEAFSKHGYCWSKVARAVPHRSDSQCLKRWKVLFPDEVPKLQAARRIRKLALVTNFVDREEERPALGPCDFIPLAIEDAPTESEWFTAEDSTSKRKRKGAPHVEKKSPTEHQPEDKPSSRKKKKVGSHSLEKKSSADHQPEDNPSSRKKGKVKPHPSKNRSVEPEPFDNQETLVAGQSSQGTASSGWKRKVKPKLLSGRTKGLFRCQEITERLEEEDEEGEEEEEDVPLMHWLRVLRKLKLPQQDIAETLDDEDIAETLADDG